MISDVPIGSFLSGGIDSSLITALMQKNSSSKIKTFSIGFNEEDYNESHYAKKIANYLNTDHHEFVLDSSLNLKQIHDDQYSGNLQSFLHNVIRYSLLH